MKGNMWRFKDLKKYLKVGRDAAYRIGRESGAAIKVSERTVLYDPEKVEKYVKEELCRK